MTYIKQTQPRDTKHVFEILSQFSRLILSPVARQVAMKSLEKLRSAFMSLALLLTHFLGAVIWGGAHRMGGGKLTREHTLPKIFGPLQKSFWSALSWIFVQEKQSTDT